MEMPDFIYAIRGVTNRFDGVWDDYQWSNQSGTQYHHSRIVEDLKENLAETVIALAARNSEIIELRRRIAELEAVIEARGM